MLKGVLIGLGGCVVDEVQFSNGIQGVSRCFLQWVNGTIIEVE